MRSGRTWSITRVGGGAVLEVGVEHGDAAGAQRVAAARRTRPKTSAAGLARGEEVHDVAADEARRRR